MFICKLHCTLDINSRLFINSGVLWRKPFSISSSLFVHRLFMTEFSFKRHYLPIHTLHLSYIWTSQWHVQIFYMKFPPPFWQVALTWYINGKWPFNLFVFTLPLNLTKTKRTLMVIWMLLFFTFVFTLTYLVFRCH